MTVNQPTCPKYRSPVTPGMKFCKSCGARIEAVRKCCTCSPGA